MAALRQFTMKFEVNMTNSSTTLTILFDSFYHLSCVIMVCTGLIVQFL